MPTSKTMHSTEWRKVLRKPGSSIHLIGVSGSGMSGLAALLLARGYHVSGSDLKKSEAIERLELSGLRFDLIHKAEHVEKAELVVFSSAIDPSNVERVRAAQRGIPEIKRADLLAVLSCDLEMIAVAGSHGKTTTTTLLTHVFREAGLDPSFYIGADAPLFGTNAAWGKGRQMIVELDESDGSIDLFSPAHTLIVNIEREHLDYFKNMESMRQAFVGLIERTHGSIVICKDDPEAGAIFASLKKQGMSYGFNKDADYRIENLNLQGDFSEFDVVHGTQKLASVKLSLPGKHNALNATGVFAMAHALDAPIDKIVHALGAFKNAKRRFEILFQDESFCVVDDYGHHPTEIRVTLAAAREMMQKVGKKRLIAAFQPHRYSRTQDLYADFLNCFDGVDVLYLTEIYAASEQPIQGVSGQKLADDLAQKQKVYFHATLKALKAHLSMALEPGDFLVILGAGDIEETGHAIAKDLELYHHLRALLTPESGIKPFEPLKKHTSMRVGGPASVWVEPATEDELAKVVRYCHQKNIPMMTIGRGSNLIIRDCGIRGVCIHLSQPHFQTIDIRPDGSIHAGAGARLRQIVTEAKRAGIGGFEFMEGIPAALGGALRMNAGAMHASTFDVVESVRWMDPEGCVHESSAHEIEIHYRRVPLFEKSIALSAVLRGVKTSPDHIAEKLAGFSKKRWSSQPAAPSAGCIFKNPETTQAGKLIDQLGLKDLRRGGARVSPVHGNFIINDGGATASDILGLIEEIKAKVRACAGIELEMEAIVLGE